MKLLNVKSTTVEEIEGFWGLKIPNHFYNKEIFVRCNSKGDINWESAPIYTFEELEERGDYQIIINLSIDEIIADEAPID